MKKAKIYINGSEIDLFDQDKLRLALTYSFADINKITARSSSFSKTITVPATKNNDKIFGFGTDINSSDAYTQNERRSAFVEVGGTVLMRGFAKMQSNVIKNSRNTGQYKFTLVGDNGDWKEKLSERNVNELDYSDQDHVYNKANIDTSETVSTARDYVYPLINYGETLGGHPISGNNNVHDVLVEDRYPALNIEKMLVRIYKGIGYKIVSSFKDSILSKLYLPFVNELLKHPDSFRTDNLFRVGLTSDINHSLPLSDINDILLFPAIGITPDRSLFLIDFNKESGTFFDTGNNFALNKYTVVNASKQKFEIKVRISFTSPEFVVGKVRLILTNNLIFIEDSTTITFAENSSPITLTIKTDFITVAPGDEIRVQIDISTNNILLANELTILKVGTSFSNDISLQVFEDSLLQLNSNRPDINQLDFIRGITDLFNLYFVTDVDTRTVYFEPRDQFYKTKALNWTDKLDKNKDETITYLNDKLKKEIRYKYADDSNDGWVDAIESESEDVIASQEITNPNKFVKGKQSAGTTLFSKTLMRPFDYAGLGTSKVPTLNTEAIAHPGISEKSTDFNLRILYYNGVKATASGESWFFDGTERTDYPYFYSVDTVSDNDNSLYYDDTRRSKGLFKKYYENLHDTLNNGKLYTAYFHLTDSDISNIDFRIPIFVKNTYYLLNKIINYDPLSSVSTKVELVKATKIDVRAIALEAEGGNGSVFVFPLSLSVVKESFDATLPPDIYTTSKKNLIVTTGFKGTGMVVRGAGSHSAHLDVVSYGPGLVPAKDRQLLIGSFNKKDTTAKMIIGGGAATARQTLAKIDPNGTFKIGDGSNVVMTLNNITVNMVFTDSLEETNIMVKSDNT